VGLERGPHSLVSTIEEPLRSRNRDYDRRGFAALIPRHPFMCKKLALTWPTSGGRSVGIVHSRTKATELLLLRTASFYRPWENCWEGRALKRGGGSYFEVSSQNSPWGTQLIERCFRNFNRVPLEYKAASEPRL
jgi:hypothetical protein